MVRKSTPGPIELRMSARNGEGSTQHIGGAIEVDWPESYSSVMIKFNIVNLNFLYSAIYRCRS